MLKQICASLLLVQAAVGLAAPSEPPSSNFTARDIFGLEVAPDPQISPDGRYVAYVRRSNDIMTDRAVSSIWMIDTRTGEEAPLVSGAGSHGQPRWSPDGKRLAYVSGDGGPAQIHVRWIAGGETARITALPATPSGLEWSPDGRQIAYSMFMPDEGITLGKAEKKPEGATWAPPLEVITAVTYRFDGQGYLKPGFNKIFVVPASGGAPRQLTFGAYHDRGPLSWSSDSRTLYFSANRSPEWERDTNESEVYALDLATANVTALTNRDGPDARPLASPDGRLIAYVGSDDRKRGYENGILYVIGRDGSGARALTASLDRDIDSVAWARDGRSLYVSYVDAGETRIARVGLDGSIRTVVTGLSGSSLDRPYSGGQFSVADDGSIAFTSGSATLPADVALFRGGNRSQLTQLNQTLRVTKRLGDVRKFTTPSSLDGRPIDTWVTLPPHYVEGRRYPMILEIHGGPHQSYGPHFSTDNQLYASAGYVVLSVNPRGSTSYGEEFANLIHLKYPGNDYDDLMSAVDAAIAQGYVDPDALFVTGGSGGGVLTSWIVGKTDRFKAAATQKPVIDWSTQLLTSDIPTTVGSYWFDALPWEKPEEYWRCSPLSLVGNVKTPTLVVVGGEDYRTPVMEAEQYYRALQLEGVPTALVKVPGAGHSSLAGRPSQSGAKANAILDWFARYKNGAPVASTSD